jgi:hypothetical protein
MLRYYLAAAAIVAIVGALAAVHAKRAHDLRIASVQVTVPPKVTQQQNDPSGHAAERFAATGAWVLSALPDCFVQTAERRGPPAFVRRALAPHALRLAAGTRFTEASCTIDVRANDVVVTRGADRMLVTSPAALYVSAGSLVLVRRDGASAEARTYAVASAP